ncbi:hypothetical protein MYX76_11265 [Desulfobacterota bacterium AH_259_B03_O07]|nr:hypothetical protein [Desulfobacterota bacterium AH_259_B03_O07]
MKKSKRLRGYKPFHSKRKFGKVKFDAERTAEIHIVIMGNQAEVITNEQQSE